MQTVPRETRTLSVVALVAGALGFGLLLVAALLFLNDTGGSFESQFNDALRFGLFGIVTIALSIVLASLSVVRFPSRWSRIALTATLIAGPLGFVIYMVLLFAFFS
jgi:hypothetical protein